VALEGNLTDFGLSEILQLIAIQQKSGMLSISTGDKSMVLFFRNGKIVSTRDRRRRSKDPLKDYFLQYGILTRNDLIRIMQIGSQSKLDITDIIISEEFLSEEELRKHFRNQIQEALHEILSWQQCSYKFLPGNDIISGIKTWGEFSIEGFLMESMRRIDELPGMLKEFPDKKMIISRVPGAEFEEQPRSNEETIWNLLDEERSVYHLIAHGRMPSFDAYEALKHLSEKQLIRTYLEVPKPAVDPEAPKQGKAKRKKSQKRRMPVAVLLLLFAVSAAIGAKNIASNFKAPAPVAVGSYQEDSLERNRVEERVRLLLEHHQALTGSYPASLDHLNQAGLATDSFLQMVERFSFRYHLTPHENTYTLL
jgi:hypothetical protein